MTHLAFRRDIAAHLLRARPLQILRPERHVWQTASPDRFPNISSAAQYHDEINTVYCFHEDSAVYNIPKWVHDKKQLSKYHIKISKSEMKTIHKQMNRNHKKSNENVIVKLRYIIDSFPSYLDLNQQLSKLRCCLNAVYQFL
ncbi:hypothetical protein T12_3666 [Trichinella patagoniensis]|uniref:Uncharacterized protein n=1 Tax=Trichinella patagoniensis TaxID=990121 RepID=A0A0V0ZTK2_9BILA|nr:hypothetical protein T12_3666 [Trichinella patagoniensis]